MSPADTLTIRPLQFRDLDWLEQCWPGAATEQLRQWFAPLKLLSAMPGSRRQLLRLFVAEQQGRPCGAIQVSPFNQSGSTWRIDRVITTAVAPSGDRLLLPQDVGARLLRHCLESIWQARTWIVEAPAEDNEQLALFRQTGFQPIARLGHWRVPAEVLRSLAAHEPDLPTLLPVGNADAALLYQLDTVSMPPLLRQVFDRHVDDFRQSGLKRIGTAMRQQLAQTLTLSGYCFEAQRKAAIGYYNLQLQQGATTQFARLTVHPAYTWLYPELFAHLARLMATCPDGDLCLTAADYQPEREAFLTRIGAQQERETVLMSRSVWHKLRETRGLSLEGLQWAEVFPGLQPGGTAIPGQVSLTPPLRFGHPSDRPGSPWDLPPLL